MLDTPVSVWLILPDVHSATQIFMGNPYCCLCTKEYIHLLVVYVVGLLRHYVRQKFLTIVYITIIYQDSKLVINAKCADFWWIK